jgi:phosphate-selective porin OprO/OprP
LAATIPGLAQSPPSSDSNLEQRVRDLEAEVRRLRQAQDNGQTIVPIHSMNDADPPPAPDVVPEQLPPPSPSSTDEAAKDKKDKADKDSTPVAGWKDGFFLQSKEKDFVLRITGQIQTDYHAYLNDRDQTDIDSSFLRRARFGLEATMFQYYDFRFLPGFGQGQTVIQDAYLNIHWWEWMQFEVGKFKQPFSYEQLIQDRFVPTVERSMIDQLTPERDVGFMVWGQKLFCDRLDYGFAVSE